MRLFVLLHLFGVICGAMRIENDLKIPPHHVRVLEADGEAVCAYTVHEPFRLFVSFRYFIPYRLFLFS